MHSTSVELFELLTEILRMAFEEMNILFSEFMVKFS